MVKVTCQEVDTSMPEPLRHQVSELLVARGSDAMQCDWEGGAPTTDELFQMLTDHMKEQHAMRSWPPEYWVYIKSCIRQAD